MNKRRVLAAFAVATTFTAGAAVTASASNGAAVHRLIRGEPEVTNVDNVPKQHTRTAAPKAAPQGSHFVSMDPVRSFDTRRPSDGGALQGGNARYLTYKKGEIDPRVTSLVVNLTVTNATANTYVTAWSGDKALPHASSINVRKGETRSNQVTIPIGHRQDGSATIALYNNAGSADVITDIAGAYGTGKPKQGETFTGYRPQTPKRVLDTRSDGGPMPGGSTKKVDLSGVVPKNADAVTVNLTALSHSSAGFLSLYPGDGRRGGTSSLNYMPGETTPNQVTVKLGADRSLALYNSAGSTDALLDVVGTYSPNAKGLYYAADPTRVVDTRDGSGTSGTKGALEPGETVNVPFPGDAKQASAVNTTVTGIAGKRSTYLTVWPNGKRPATSNLNLAAGRTASNAASVGMAHGSAKVYNNAGDTDLVVDASGYFAPEGAGQ